MGTEIATIEQHSMQTANPLDASPAEFRSALVRRGDNRKSMIDWIRSALKDGVDFGVIQTRKGPSKPSLRKPGAEKICGMLGVTATFPTLNKYEDAALEGKDIQSIILRCHLLSADGRVVADGIGARSLSQDFGDLNKALKMASKSAHIDATLRMAGLSEIFTQDLEDMKPEQMGEQSENPAPVGREPPAGLNRPPHNTTGQIADADKEILFGKHRGTKWRDVNPEYLQWLAFEAAPRAGGAKELAQAEINRREAEEERAALATDYQREMPPGFTQ